MARLKTAVFISGRGSNMQALVEACTSPDKPAEIVLVLSNVANAEGLKFAQEAGIKTTTIDHRQFPDRESFEQKITSSLIDAGVR